MEQEVEAVALDLSSRRYDFSNPDAGIWFHNFLNGGCSREELCDIIWQGKAVAERPHLETFDEFDEVHQKVQRYQELFLIENEVIHIDGELKPSTIGQGNDRAHFIQAQLPNSTAAEIQISSSWCVESPALPDWEGHTLPELSNPYGG